MKTTNRFASIALAASSLALPAFAQVPDKIETRLGTLTFDHALPTPAGFDWSAWGRFADRTC